ncbi:F0F1 ATP synthase subunit gamma [Corynebacterium sanguinis]|uniref:F0F1 ATP synthase subunit gamma n=1 Tax=Corynebacterium sanguinis TaxID=2594913 RepID=UPI0011A340FE|nr:F0F1 ATP synthase subunit gamma [Corynebacterium sanguinis]MCT1499463.1 F0F1 ATP synthase subunit gamma [Corynebacterium sanguinis]MCT1556147.1 F0F1 ATP synthase subunit gamma [Corynebacterium sanguinis]MCT1613486.1 F0F1 ATP synthase subunit gamma [Corynebacterium sanguinis]MCT1694180.1 F0F1 ATP synthase subunit gamma [Corynebacterium sanguinis]MCT1713620.1 F0F1 ATP synthase subunit gamma [Corynebacterium sanguinis]
MATLRELRDRIRSVNSTKKITKAQELIATSQITKAQQRVEAAKPYADELLQVMERLAAASSLDHPMLHERENGRVAAILVVTSDRGMAGGYNHNVLKKATELERTLEEAGYEVVRFVAGGKGVTHYKFRDQKIGGAWTGWSQKPSWEATHDVRRHLIDGFLAGSEGTVEWREGVNAAEGERVPGFDQVHVVYTEFVSMLSQEARVHQLLPIEPVLEEFNYEQDGMLSSSGEVGPDMEFEPDPDTLMDKLLPAYVSRTLYSMFLEASASESASRRTAMKNATDNATELANNLSREANQARQAQITQEITEIIGGAGALADSGESD